MMKSAEICSCEPILPPQDQARESEPSIHESKGVDCNATRSDRFGIDCVGAGRSRWKRLFSGTTAIPFHAFATIFAECADLWHIRSYQYSYCVTRRRLNIDFFVHFLFIESVVYSSPERCIRSTSTSPHVLEQAQDFAVPVQLCFPAAARSPSLARHFAETLRRYNSGATNMEPCSTIHQRWSTGSVSRVYALCRQSVLPSCP